MKDNYFQKACQTAAGVIFAGGVIAGLIYTMTGAFALGLGLVNLTVNCYILSAVLDINERIKKFFS